MLVIFACPFRFGNIGNFGHLSANFPTFYFCRCGIIICVFVVFLFCLWFSLCYHLHPFWVRFGAKQFFMFNIEALNYKLFKYIFDKTRIVNFIKLSHFPTQKPPLLRTRYKEALTGTFRNYQVQKYAAKSPEITCLWASTFHAYGRNILLCFPKIPNVLHI